MPQPTFHFIGRGVYTVAESSQLIRLNPSRITRWTRGYAFTHKGRRRFSPPIVGHSADSRSDATSLSFLDLIEILYLDFFHREGVTLSGIRKTMEKARVRLKTEHPFATHRFRTDGKWILEEAREETGDHRLYNLITEQVESGRLLETVLRGDLDVDADNIARRWWPMGRERLVVVDPTRRFGAPIVHQTGIPTRILAMAYKAEGSYKVAAEWWEVDIASVKAAVRFERQLAA